MIVEGIVTTRNADGSVNIAPMGPSVSLEWQRLALRPFPTATTCANLLRERVGVFHVTDDCELLARAAIDQLDDQPELAEIEPFPVPRLADTCRWYAFHVETIDATGPRVCLECSIHSSGRVRDFLGFNRAKHAVLEAAILATRVHLLSAESLRGEFDRLRVIVEKTAGDQERRGFAVLEEFVRTRLA
jgi:hypothetical protein